MLSDQISNLEKDIASSKSTIEISSVFLSELTTNRRSLTTELQGYEATLSSNKDQLRLLGVEFNQVKRNIDALKRSMQSSNDFILTEVKFFSEVDL